MTPQAATILTHLQKRGSITPVEAQTVHRCRHLPARIHELRGEGVKIGKTLHKDVTGQRYSYYTLGAEETV